MTQLRDRMLEELERRNYSPGTARCYLHAVQQFAEHFHRSPDQLGAEQIREYQLYLLRERKLSPKTVAQRTAALRFFYVKTLKRRYMLEHLPFPKLPEKLPIVLSRDEVSRLLAASANRMLDLPQWPIRFTPPKGWLDQFAFLVTDGTPFVVSFSLRQAVHV